MTTIEKIRAEIEGAERKIIITINNMGCNNVGATQRRMNTSSPSLTPLKKNRKFRLIWTWRRNWNPGGITISKAKEMDIIVVNTSKGVRNLILPATSPNGVLNT